MKISVRTMAVIGIISGIVMVIVGMALLSNNTFIAKMSFHIATYKFGADFYTEAYAGIQESVLALDALYQVLYDIANFLEKAFGGIFMAFGVFTICHFGVNIYDKTIIPISNQSSVMPDSNNTDKSIDEDLPKF